MGWRNPLVRLLRTITAAGNPGVDIGTLPPGWNAYFRLQGDNDVAGAAGITIYDAWSANVGEYAALNVSNRRFNLWYRRNDSTLRNPIDVQYNGNVDERLQVTAREPTSGNTSQMLVDSTGIAHAYIVGSGAAAKQVRIEVYSTGGRVTCDELALTAPPYPVVYPFANGWDHYDPVNWQLGSYVKSAGLVTLRGLIHHANISQTGVMFTLPAGYRPRQTLIFTAWASGGLARVDVYPTGEVLLQGYTSGGNASYVSLSGISFHPSPS